jgi:hypothetical protein
MAHAHLPAMAGPSTVAVGPEASGTPGAAGAAAIEARAQAAAAVLGAIVRPLSHPQALETAFRDYYRYRAAHPSQRNGLLLFADYGLPNDQERGYLFDMDGLRIVEGPFMISHGRGSRTDRHGLATRFSNRRGSLASSLGLFVGTETYSFTGRATGRSYRSTGLRLDGLSGPLNDNARARHVVAHGAPYVTDTRAGHSEGCPALEPDRARRLLPRLADGGLLFLFAPALAGPAMSDLNADTQRR